MHDKEYRKRDAPRIECKILVFLLAMKEEPTNAERAEPSLLELCLARRRTLTSKKEDFPIYAIGQDL